jgi:uncharacterized protein (DUF433 family)
MSTVSTERITKRAGICGGRACIAGHRIRVMDIVVLYDQMGMTPAEIIDQFPTITLSDVHSAMAYYYDHMDEIQDDISQEADVAERLRSHFPSKITPE